MAADIASHPEDFADAEAFRNFHAKARFRATITTITGVLLVGAFAAPKLGYKSGTALISGNRLITTPVILGTWCVSYFIFNRLNGWNH